MNRSTPLSSTLGALAGVGFAVLFLFSLAVIDPLKNPTNQELLTWWADVGKQRDSMISMYSMLLSAPLFLIFLVQLCNRLRSAGQSAESWSGLVFGAGVAYVALVAVTAFSRGVIAQSIRVSDEPIPGPDTLRYATALSQAAFSLAAIPFAAIVVAAGSVIIVRTGVLARWLGWLGLVVAAVSLVTVLLLVGALASPLILLWVVATSFVIWRTRNVLADDAAVTSPGAVSVSAPSASR